MFLKPYPGMRRPVRAGTSVAGGCLCGGRRSSEIFLGSGGPRGGYGRVLVCRWWAVCLAGVPKTSERLLRVFGISTNPTK